MKFHALKETRYHEKSKFESGYHRYAAAAGGL